MKPTFTPLQKTLLTTCTVIYTAAYICRLNLSAALGGIMEDMALSMAQAGLLQTVFAAVYAMGQLINGTIADRVNPVRYMLLGISGTAVCNFAMGFAGSYPMLLAIWALNAAFQSMMWTPIMRQVAIHFTVVPVRERANETLALTLIVGHFLAWAISGFLSVQVSWRLSFIVPAAIAAVVFLGGRRVLHAAGITGREKAKQTAASAQGSASTFSILASTGFFLVLITCLCYGFIRDGVVTWTPTVLGDVGGGRSVSSTGFSLILPLINICGVLTGFRLRRRGAQPHGVVALLLAVAMICCFPLLAGKGMLVMAVLLGLICACMYGANTMLTALIPLEYHAVGKTGMTAGMIDSFIYAGSALAGVFGGSLYEGFGADMLYLSWIAAGAAAFALMYAAGRMSRRYWEKAS